jgi:hypothetical protein
MFGKKRNIFSKFLSQKENKSNQDWNLITFKSNYVKV